MNKTLTDEEIVEEFMNLHKATQGKWRIERHTATDWLRTTLSQVRKEAYQQGREEKEELYDALERMWEQYCPEPYTHMYMQAGENCERVLEKYKYLTHPKDKE